MTRKTSPQPLLIFTSGGLRFGVFLAEIGRLTLEERIAPVPFSHPAMAGLSYVDGATGAVPVFDVVGLLDPTRGPRRRATGTTIALFPTERGPIGLRLDVIEGTVLEVQPVSAEEEREALSGLPDEVRRVVGGVARHAGSTLFFFSPEGLLVELGLLIRG